MYIYILFTKESTDFGLELSVAYRVSVHCKLKKSEKIHKDFWTTSSRHILFYVPNYSNIPNIYIIHKKYRYILVWGY